MWQLAVIPSRQEGRFGRSSRNVGRDCGGRVGHVRRTWARCGRRSRVVLAPRRWRQVRGDASHHAGDGGNKARSPGRARRKPLKPSRRECRDASAEPVCSCAFLVERKGTRDRGCSQHPAFPAPSAFQEGRSLDMTRARYAARRRTRVRWRHCEERERRSNPEWCAERFWIASLRSQ